MPFFAWVLFALACAGITAVPLSVTLADGVEDIPEASDDRAEGAVDIGKFFAALPGRWVGEGRFYTKGNQSEKLSCRVTYFLKEKKTELRQNIRCASAGAHIEVKSIIRNGGKTISGTWRETVYEMHGTLTGHGVRNGLRVRVNGGNVAATMQILMVKGKQIAEIQFSHSTLVGMTIILKKG